jgi:hypothetical protein
MDLVEVSILDDTKSPAYYGTSIETRSEDGAAIEIRENTGDDPVDIEHLADLVADRVIERLNTQKEEKREDEDPPEKTEESTETEERAIDYSEYEERIAKLN